LAANKNSQENIFFGCSLLLPRKCYIPWRLNFDRQEKARPPR
jgi:hypothetical protein